jgi:hypothetical protein
VDRFELLATTGKNAKNNRPLLLPLPGKLMQSLLSIQSNLKAVKALVFFNYQI